MATPANNFISHRQNHVCLYIFTFSKNLLAEITSIWEVTSCRLVYSYQRFLYTEDGGIASHRRVTKSSQCTKQNDVTSQKPVILKLTAITTQNIGLTLRLLMSYIYIYIYIYMEHLFLMFLDHTQRRSTVGRTPLDE